MPTDEYITIKEAAQTLNCSARTIRRWVDTGKIDTRIEYQGKQAIRYVRRGDILREAGTIQHREPKEEITEVVTRGTTYDNLVTSIGQVKKVVTGLIWKITAIVAGIIILGGVTGYYLVIGQGKQNRDQMEGVKQKLSQGLSQVQDEVVTGLNATRKGLTEKIEAIRTDTRKANQTTTEIINNQTGEILRTGDRVKAQAAKIEAQTVEIKELRAQLIEFQSDVAGIRALGEQMKAINARLEKMDRELAREEETPARTPAPAAAVPPDQKEEEPEKGGSFTGMF